MLIRRKWVVTSFIPSYIQYVQWKAAYYSSIAGICQYLTIWLGICIVSRSSELCIGTGRICEDLPLHSLHTCNLMDDWLIVIMPLNNLLQSQESPFYKRKEIDAISSYTFSLDGYMKPYHYRGSNLPNAVSPKIQRYKMKRCIECRNEYYFFFPYSSSSSSASNKVPTNQLTTFYSNFPSIWWRLVVVNVDVAGLFFFWNALM